MGARGVNVRPRGIGTYRPDAPGAYPRQLPQIKGETPALRGGLGAAGTVTGQGAKRGLPRDWQTGDYA